MIKNLSLHQAVKKPVYPHLQMTGLFLMSVYILWLFAPYVINCRYNTLKLMVLLILISVLFGTLLPKKVLNNNFLSDSDATNQELNNQIFHKKKSR